jgi:hypothetical protein
MRLFLAVAVLSASAICFAQDPEPAPTKPVPPAAKKAWEKAEKAIERNRENYEEANTKSLAVLAKDLEKLNPAVPVDDLVQQFRGYIASLDAKAAPPAPPPPNKDTFVFNGHRYQVVLETLSWSDAKKWCEDRGGYLAILDSKPEHTAVRNALLVYQKANIQRLGDFEVWIGASRDPAAKKWLWVNNTAMLYSDWEAHFPIGQEKRDFAVLNATVGNFRNFWDDVRPNLYFLCEWDQQQ